MSNNKTGVGIGILVFVVIIIASFAWFISLFQQQDEAIAEGCIIRTFNQYGLATSMVCPGQAGYETALLSN
jgi:hypothetical protein